MKLNLYGPEYMGSDEAAFCCMTYGFANTEVATAECRSALEDIESEMCVGSYEACLEFVRTLTSAKSSKEIKAAIVITNNKGGENVFMKELSEILHCPIVGGGAAIGGNPAVPSMPNIDAPVQILCITDPRVKAEAVFENIHDEILGEYDLEFTNPRVLDRVNGEDAVEFLKRIKAEYGLAETDFEHMTFSTAEHINAHLNKNDGVHIASGRDLEHKMLLRYVDPKKVQERMEAFYDEPNALVFGCAGLRGIMEHTHETSSFAGYFFGEICTVNGHCDFGNLMLSKLRITV